MAQALERLGWQAELCDWRGDLDELMRRLQPPPELVFNALHGGDGEDGTLASLFALAGVPCTHSGPLASALAMDKSAARSLFAGEGLRLPDARVFSPAALKAALGEGDPMPRPYVVKPVSGGSSLGVQIVREGDNGPLPPESGGDDIIVEQYIPGRELTVSVLDGEALAVTELRAHGGFYDYDAKYSQGLTEHLVPAPVPDALAAEALDAAERAHRLLGCRSVTRSDFRWDEHGGAGEGPALYFLEINTQPG